MSVCAWWSKQATTTSITVTLAVFTKIVPRFARQRKETSAVTSLKKENERISSKFGETELWTKWVKVSQRKTCGDGEDMSQWCSLENKKNRSQLLTTSKQNERHHGLQGEMETDQYGENAHFWTNSCGVKDQRTSFAKHHHGREAV